MNSSVDIEVVRAEALRKLGRNVLNFSKLENGFKLLLSVSYIEGKTTSHNSLKARQHRLRKQSLGTLVTEFNRDVIRNEEAASAQQPTRPGLSLSFVVPSTHSKKWKQTLRTLVEERNRLIHQDLALIDMTSVDDYCNLITVLDEQNPRLLAQLENLRWMLCSLCETVQSLKHSSELRQLINSLNQSA